jgi:hypothetical protein
VVGPLLGEFRPGLVYAAARLGTGSDVLGFDSARSTDHDWGPRLQVLLADEAESLLITDFLGPRLPRTFRGYPVFFPASNQPAAGPRHWVEVTGLRSWLTGLLGFDPTGPVGLEDWLATPTQRLAEVTAGAVYHDGPGELTRVRARLTWYPDDVWRYVLACQWSRIGQEEAFPGRCAEAGDELGAAVIRARLARDVMLLWLLMHRRYPPYSKWLGSAFARLPGAARIGPELAGAISGADWERHLARAYVLTAELHNDLGLTEPLDTATRPYYDRPYQVIGAGRLADALLATIGDPGLRARPPIGAVDQFLDSTDALGRPPLRRAAVGAAADG